MTDGRQIKREDGTLGNKTYTYLGSLLHTEVMTKKSSITAISCYCKKHLHETQKKYLQYSAAIFFNTIIGQSKNQSTPQNVLNGNDDDFLASESATFQIH